MGRATVRDVCARMPGRPQISVPAGYGPGAEVGARALVQGDQ